MMAHDELQLPGPRIDVSRPLRLQRDILPVMYVKS